LRDHDDRELGNVSACVGVVRAVDRVGRVLSEEISRYLRASKLPKEPGEFVLWQRERLDADRDVELQFGHQRGQGGATDLLSGDSQWAEGLDEPLAFALEQLLPPWVVVNDLDPIAERRLGRVPGSGGFRACGSNRIARLGYLLQQAWSWQRGV
jgi:hypothetical protein